MVGIKYAHFVLQSHSYSIEAVIEACQRMKKIEQYPAMQFDTFVYRPPPLTFIVHLSQRYVGMHVKLISFSFFSSHNTFIFLCNISWRSPAKGERYSIEIPPRLLSATGRHHFKLYPLKLVPCHVGMFRMVRLYSPVNDTRPGTVT